MTGKTNNHDNVAIQDIIPRIISMWEHSGWGNSINWRDWEKRSIYGHLNQIPKKGDILRCKMDAEF